MSPTGTNGKSSSAVPDGGWGWVITFSSFMHIFLVNGVILSYGVLFPEFIQHFGESRSKTQSLNSVLAGTSRLLGPLAACLINRIGSRMTTIIGAVIASTGIFLSTFSPNLDIMILMYGVVAGTGFGLMYTPAIVIVGHYFNKRRALASGIAVCGSGVGSLVFPQLIVFLLETYGWQGTQWIVSGMVLNGVVFGSLYRQLGTQKDIQKRDVPTGKQEMCWNFDFSLLTSPTYVLYLLMSSLVYLGYLIPSNFLPAVAISKGLSNSEVANLLLIAGITNTTMKILAGIVSDQSWVNTICFNGVALVIGGTLSCFVPFYEDYLALMVYAGSYVMFIAVFWTLTTSVIVELMGIERLTHSFGLSTLFQGIAVFIGAPLGGTLADSSGNYKSTFYFSGLSIGMAGLTSLLLRRVSRWEKSRRGSANLEDTYQETSVYWTGITRIS